MHVGTQLRQSLDNLRYRFTVAPTAYDLREIGITTHAEIVRIHPFQDGNGRLSRLVADLVFIISQREENLLLYDWRVDRRRYIELLREYDRYAEFRISAIRWTAGLCALVGCLPWSGAW